MKININGTEYILGGGRRMKKITHEEFEKYSELLLQNSDNEWVEDDQNFGSWFEVRDEETGESIVSGNSDGNYWAHV